MWAERMWGEEDVCSVAAGVPGTHNIHHDVGACIVSVVVVVGIGETVVRWYTVVPWVGAWFVGHTLVAEMRIAFFDQAYHFFVHPCRARYLYR